MPAYGRDFGVPGVHGGVRRLDTPQQFRPVNLAVIHQHVCVDLGGRREVALPDPRSDFRPTHPLMVEQADPPMTKIVRAEDWDAGVATSASNCHPKTVA